MVAILEKRSLRDFDWPLALLALMIVVFGTWQIHNAQPTESYWQKQLLGLGVALVAMVAVASTDYRKLMHIAPAYQPEIAVIALIENVGFGGTHAAPAARAIYDAYYRKTRHQEPPGAQLAQQKKKQQTSVPAGTTVAMTAHRQ